MPLEKWYLWDVQEAVNEKYRILIPTGLWF